MQQLHRNRTLWVERPDHFSGRSKVARRSQTCAKGLSPGEISVLEDSKVGFECMLGFKQNLQRNRIPVTLVADSGNTYLTTGTFPKL